jgi:D-alanyl-D-alanine carboxypeptidase (penicillin-binding protein 5/6)
MDVNSGKVIAEKASTERRAPASLTKMMTLYIISDSLKKGRIKLDDTVRISKNAWQAGGSRMFVKVGEMVSIRDLIKGIIVDSGNDACVAMAEHLAGGESAFADVMNQYAQALGMKNSHFVDSTGMPNANHYTTANDIALLAQALIRNFPNDYSWYKEKWFKYNNIRQPNRNRLLWRDPTVDGLKTGHTEEAGFCLAASAERNKMRLLAVILGAPTDAERAEDTQRLLNFGFRFFETHTLYKGKQQLALPRVWQGQENTVPVGLASDFLITIPRDSYKLLKAEIELPNTLSAPIKEGQTLGQVKISINDKLQESRPLIALKENPAGGLWRRWSDRTRLLARRWFGGNKS